MRSQPEPTPQSPIPPIAFVPGYPPDPTGLLARYLPPLPEGVAGAYVARCSAPGDLVLDPFGSSPRIAIEAVQLGRRAVVVSHNPIIQFALKVAFDPPTEELARTALTRLADARAAGGRVEQVLRDMYRTTCPDCGQAADAEFFAWQGDALLEKRFICATCGEDKIRPTDAADAARAARFPPRGPSYHWALSCVASAGHPDQQHAARALAAYTSRAVQAIFTLVTKANAIALPPEVRRSLDALLLLAFDEASSLWPYPAERGRPKTLNPHQRFRERNIWLALEKGVASFGAAQRVPTAELKALLEGSSGAVACVPGPLNSVYEALGHRRFALALTTVPRPNPVLWVLSVIWAAWLWAEAGRENFRSLLRRRRYDWPWHEQALRASLGRLRPLLAPAAPLVGLLPEAEAPFLASALTAADAAGWALAGFALESGGPAAQLYWQPDPGSPAPTMDALPIAIRRQTQQSVVAALAARGEPASWPFVHAAAVAALARHHTLRAAAAAVDDPLATVDDALQTALQASAALVRISEDPAAVRRHDPWWLADPPIGEQALAERVEVEVAGLLAAHAEIEPLDVLAQVCERLPGLLTPSPEWVQRCLASYGQQTDVGAWRCRPEDMPAARAEDFDATCRNIRQLGEQLGFAVQTTAGNVLQWLASRHDEAPRVRYVFIVLTAAAIGPQLLADPPLAEQRVLVVPGGRSELIRYRLEIDLRLRRAVDDYGWTFLKYRHVRRLLSETDLDPTALNTVLGLDPIVEHPGAQIPLF